MCAGLEACLELALPALQGSLGRGLQLLPLLPISQALHLLHCLACIPGMARSLPAPLQQLRAVPTVEDEKATLYVGSSEAKTNQDAANMWSPYCACSLTSGASSEAMDVARISLHTLQVEAVAQVSSVTSELTYALAG